MDWNDSEGKESHRLEALICSAVGWQVDELHVIEYSDVLVLSGHARCAFARRLAVVEAERLGGRRVEDRIKVN
jgi:hypothetical protein